jgi:hypothetical protein
MHVRSVTISFVWWNLPLNLLGQKQGFVNPDTHKLFASDPDFVKVLRV